MLNEREELTGRVEAGSTTALQRLSEEAFDRGSANPLGSRGDVEPVPNTLHVPSEHPSPKVLSGTLVFSAMNIGEIGNLGGATKRSEGEICRPSIAQPENFQLPTAKPIAPQPGEIQLPSAKILLNTDFQLPPGNVRPNSDTPLPPANVRPGSVDQPPHRIRPSEVAPRNAALKPGEGQSPQTPTRPSDTQPPTVRKHEK